MHDPVLSEFNSGEQVFTYTFVGMGKRLPNGSWMERKRVKLYIRALGEDAKTTLLELKAWDYIEATGFMGSQVMSGRYGEKAAPCLIATRIAKLTPFEAERRFAEAKHLTLAQNRC